jgi:hypothetical protein
LPPHVRHVSSPLHLVLRWPYRPHILSTIKFANSRPCACHGSSGQKRQYGLMTFTIWKYWKGCVKKLDGSGPNFLPTTRGSCITTMHLLSQHCPRGSS